MRMHLIKKFVSWTKIVLGGYLKNDGGMYAAGLTYFSMLTLVPLLCVLLLVARTLNAEKYVRNQINDQIELAITNIENGQDDELAAAVATDEEKLKVRKQAAQEFGRQARNLSNQLFSKIEKFDINTLGWIGFIFLLWSLISSISMFEVSLNKLWGVKKQRVIYKRIWLYLLIVTILPILVALAMSVPLLNITKNIIISTLGATWLTQWVSDGLITLLDSWILRFAFTLFFSSLTFAFIFYIVPNCKVSFRHALRGGIITSLLFGGWMKICAIAQVGIANSSALYGSFAFLPIVLAWIYMSWQIVLLGSSMVRAFSLIKINQNI